VNVLITGAEQGLGQAVKDICEQHGWDVYGVPRELLLISSSLKDSIIEFLYDLPTIDVVVNNFGINHLSWIGHTEPQDEQILRINVMVPYWVINALVRRGDVCNVVNVASQTHKVPQRCTSLYAASKAALVQMTRVMARELAPEGWRINVFCPGKMSDTEMADLCDKQVLELRGWSQEEAEKYALALIPMGRFTTTAECAQMVMTILEASSYLNGAVIDFTGGI